MIKDIYAYYNFGLNSKDDEKETFALKLGTF